MGDPGRTGGDVVIGLDSGTTATKAVSAGVDGRVRATASVGYPLQVPAPGRAEIDADRLRAAAIEALRQVADTAREDGDRVVAVCLSAAMHGLVPMDNDGMPRGPVLTWADARSADEARRLVDDGRAADLHARTGTPVHPMSPLTKLAWWSKADPQLVRDTPRWGGVKELVIAALCETHHVVDRSCASATGLYDIHDLRWDPEALEVAGVRPEQLAEVVAATEVLGTLRPAVAEATGLPRDTPLVVGASDGVLANLGVGAVQEGIATVSIGTSAALRAVRSVPAIDEAGRLFCYALADERWVLGGAVNNGGSVVRWASRAFAAPFDDSAPEGEAADELDARLLEEAAAVPAGSDGLLCLPYFFGERAPWWQPGLRGAYVGLRRRHGRGQLTRAAVEGVCQQLALVRDAVEAAGLSLTEVRATGGAVASPLWVAVLAATLDLPVRVADSPEGTGLGASLLGLYAQGAFSDLDEAASVVALHDPVEPAAADAQRYRRTRPLIERTTHALVEVFAELDQS